MISASPGADTLPARHAAARSGAGFTLIELLVVLAIIAVTVAMIRLGGGVLDRVSAELAGEAGGEAGDSSRLALQRLSRSLAAAGDQALARGRPMALDLAAGRYRFSSLDVAGRWVAIDNNPLFAERATPKDWRWATVQRDGEALAPPYRLLFANEAKPFSIGIETAGGHYVVRGSSLGDVNWAAK